MRKILFFFIVILILVLFKQNVIIDKEIVNNNLMINYPYLGNANVNNKIYNYINNITINSEKIIVDYDYVSVDNMLTFYQTKINNNLITERINTFRVTKNNLIKVNNIKKVNDYDFYNNKKIDKNTKLISFTFDDGPNYNTSKVIDVLNKYNVTATFFVMGKNIIGNEKIIEKMYKSNMEIGNHTYSHLLLTKYSKDKIKDEINKTQELIFDITGSYPKLLRPSYGSFNKKIKEVSDMPIIIWDIDTLDWKYKDSKKIANKILNKVSDGDIILMHDIYKATLNSLDIVIPKLLEQGYQIVSVSELFYYKEKELEKGMVYGYVN